MKPIRFSNHARLQMNLRGASEEDVIAAIRIQYESEVDALYIEFRPLEPGTAENRELSEDVIANYGPDGRLAGLEVLNASVVVGDNLKKVILEVSPVQHAVA